MGGVRFAIVREYSLFARNSTLTAPRVARCPGSVRPSSDTRAQPRRHKGLSNSVVAVTENKSGNSVTRSVVRE